MSKLKMFALATVAVLGLTGSANAATPMLAVSYTHLTLPTRRGV